MIKIKYSFGQCWLYFHIRVCVETTTSNLENRCSSTFQSNSEIETKHNFKHFKKKIGKIFVLNLSMWLEREREDNSILKSKKMKEFYSYYVFHKEVKWLRQRRVKTWHDLCQSHAWRDIFGLWLYFSVNWFYILVTQVSIFFTPFSCTIKRVLIECSIINFKIK